MIRHSGSRGSGRHRGAAQPSGVEVTNNDRTFGVRIVWVFEVDNNRASTLGIGSLGVDVPTAQERGSVDIAEMGIMRSEGLGDDDASMTACSDWTRDG